MFFKIECPSISDAEQGKKVAVQYQPGINAVTRLGTALVVDVADNQLNLASTIIWAANGYSVDASDDDIATLKSQWPNKYL